MSRRAGVFGGDDRLGLGVPGCGLGGHDGLGGAATRGVLFQRGHRDVLEKKKSKFTASFPLTNYFVLENLEEDL